MITFNSRRNLLDIAEALIEDNLKQQGIRSKEGHIRKDKFYLMDFCTIVLRTYRGAGHTTAIKSILTKYCENSLVIFPTRHMKDLFVNSFKNELNRSGIKSYSISDNSIFYRKDDIDRNVLCLTQNELYFNPDVLRGRRLDSVIVNDVHAMGCEKMAELYEIISTCMVLEKYCLVLFIG